MVEAYAKRATHEFREDGNDFCNSAVVKVSRPIGLVLFIVNIFLPGIGTIISAFLEKSLLGRRKMNGLALLFGIL